MNNTKVVIKKQYRKYVLQALARHFKKDKQELFDSVDLDSDDILFVEPLTEFRFEHPIYVAKVEQLHLPNFFNGDKFAKSEVYNEFVHGESRLKDDYAAGYFMALSIREDVFVLYRSNGYKGLGGVFFKTSDGEGFVLEPIKNFLNFRYPNTDEISVD